MDLFGSHLDIIHISVTHPNCDEAQIDDVIKRNSISHAQAEPEATIMLFISQIPE